MMSDAREEVERETGEELTISEDDYWREIARRQLMDELKNQDE